MAPFPQKQSLIRPEGRPSLYRPEYCELLLEATEKEGISLTAFAGLIRVSQDTIYEWQKRHSAFSDACSRAKPIRLLWWERKLGRSRKGAETTASVFALRNINPMEWRDVRHISTDVNVRVETLSDAQLFAIASGKSIAESNVIDGECEHIATG